jgi:hypothetical protein
MANTEKKTIVGSIIDDIKADATAQHEIDKANFAAVKADTKTRFQEVTAPDQDFTEFREAKGLKSKVAVVGAHLARDGREHRAQGRENYEKMLSEQREHINSLTQRHD